MQAKDDRPLSAMMYPTALGAVFLLGIVSTVVSCAGCSDNSPKSNTPAASVPSPDGRKDLIGVWAQTSGKGTRYYPKLQLHFNKNGIVTLGDANRKDEWSANYRVEGKSLIFTDKDGNTLRYDIGQLSDSELLLGNHALLSSDNCFSLSATIRIPVEPNVRPLVNDNYFSRFGGGGGESASPPTADSPPPPPAASPPTAVEGLLPLLPSVPARSCRFFRACSAR